MGPDGLFIRRIMDILELGLFSFGSSSVPVVQAAVEPPTEDDEEVEEAKRKERELARLRRGRSSTILTSPTGLSDTTENKKTLLGE